MGTNHQPPTRKPPTRPGFPPTTAPPHAPIPAADSSPDRQWSCLTIGSVVGSPLGYVGAVDGCPATSPRGRASRFRRRRRTPGKARMCTGAAAQASACIWRGRIVDAVVSRPPAVGRREWPPQRSPWWALFRRAPSRSAHTPGTDRVQPPAVELNPTPFGRTALRAFVPRLAWGVPAPRHGDLPHQPEKSRSDPAARRRPPRRTFRPGSSAPHSGNHTRPTRSAIPSGRRPTGESLPRLSRRTKRIANVRPYRQVAPQ